jgi:hypothetical protein
MITLRMHVVPTGSGNRYLNLARVRDAGSRFRGHAGTIADSDFGSANSMLRAARWDGSVSNPDKMNGRIKLNTGDVPDGRRSDGGESASSGRPM